MNGYLGHLSLILLESGLTKERASKTSELIRNVCLQMEVLKSDVSTLKDKLKRNEVDIKRLMRDNQDLRDQKADLKKKVKDLEEGQTS